MAMWKTVGQFILMTVVLCLAGFWTGFSGVLQRDAKDLRENMDVHMIAPIQSDMPAGFGYMGDAGWDNKWSIHGYWSASPPDPAREISPENQAREGLDFAVRVGTDAADARKAIDNFDSAISPIQGTYSGAKIGDFSLRGLGDGRRSACLRVTRGNVMILVGMFSQLGLRSNCAEEVERIARLMIARADAAIKYAAAPEAIVQVAGRAIKGRAVKGAGTVALVADVGQALGVQVTKDKTGSRVTLTVKGKKVELLVGGSAAFIDGRESTLKFPSLQTGNGGVLCLLEPIAAAFGSQVSK